ncbi:hypothetical protein [Shewanella sp.]|uniref:hypothetical protein n=1 Tax=Shewanella sp. TaxID=50422 RepID=UPI003F30F7D4
MLKTILFSVVIYIFSSTSSYAMSLSCLNVPAQNNDFQLKYDNEDYYGKCISFEQPEGYGLYVSYTRILNDKYDHAEIRTAVEGGESWSAINHTNQRFNNFDILEKYGDVDRVYFRIKPKETAYKKKFRITVIKDDTLKGVYAMVVMGNDGQKQPT